MAHVREELGFGFCARLSRAARLRKIPILPELFTYLNIVLFGLEVTPRCEIGPGIFFPHPSGTVIGAWRIGKNATILQGVTLGAQKMDLGFDSALRPEVGDNVLLGAGMLAAVLRGLEFEQVLILGLVMVVLWLGRRAFYRPAEIMAQRFTPVWIVSLAIVISTAVWIGFFAYRHVDYSHSLWWTFAFEADAPRMLRASLVVVLWFRP